MDFRVCFDNEEFRFRADLTGHVESVEPTTIKPSFFSTPVTKVPVVRLFAYGKDFLVVIAMGESFWIFNGRYFRTKEESPFRKVSTRYRSRSPYCVSKGTVFGFPKGNDEPRDYALERLIAEEAELSFGVESKSWLEYIFGTDKELEVNYQSWWFTKRLDLLVREVENLPPPPKDIYVYFTKAPKQPPDMLLQEEPILPTPPTGQGLSPIDAYNLPLRFVTHIPVGDMTWREFLHSSRALELWVGEAWDCPSKESDSRVLSFWKTACELLDSSRYF